MRVAVGLVLALLAAVAAVESVHTGAGALTTPHASRPPPLRADALRAAVLVLVALHRAELAREATPHARPPRLRRLALALLELVALAVAAARVGVAVAYASGTAASGTAVALVQIAAADALQGVGVAVAVAVALAQHAVHVHQQARTVALALLAVVPEVADALALFAVAVAVAAHLHALHLDLAGTAPVARLAEEAVGALTHEQLFVGVLAGVHAGSVARALHHSSIHSAQTRTGFGATDSMVAGLTRALRLVRVRKSAGTVVRANQLLLLLFIIEGLHAGICTVISKCIREASALHAIPRQFADPISRALIDVFFTTH